MKVVDISRKLLFVCAVAMPGLAVSLVLSGALRGAGDVQAVLLIMAGTTWIIRLIPSCLLAIMAGQRRAKIAKLLFAYECSRCGDSYECASEDDLFAVIAHRVLHQAGDWKCSFLATRLWAARADGTRLAAE